MNRTSVDRLHILRAQPRCPERPAAEAADRRSWLWTKVMRRGRIWQRAAVLGLAPALVVGILCAQVTGPKWALALSLAAWGTIICVAGIAQGWQFVETGALSEMSHWN